LEGWDFRLVTTAPAYPVARGLLEVIEARKLAGSPLEARWGDAWTGVCAMLKQTMPLFRAGTAPRDPDLRPWVRSMLAEGYRRRGYGASQKENTGWMRAAGPGSGSGASSTPAPNRPELGVIRHLPYQDVPEGYGAERFGSLAPEHDLDSPPLRAPL